MTTIRDSQYKALIEQSLDGIVLADEQGNIELWNKAMSTITGIQQTDAIGRPIHEIQSRLIPEEQKTPELLEQIRNNLKNILESKTEWTGQSREQEIVCADGTRKVVQDSSFMVKTDTGNNFGAILRDITERKQSETSMRESEERFHALFEKAPLGYQSLDGDGRFIEVNLAWLETLGYKREEVLGKWFGDFLAPEYVQAFRERFPVFKAQGKIHSEFYMLHKDGSRRYIAFDGRIGHNTDGSFKQTHCILKDETERKRAETRLAEIDTLHSKMIDNIGDVIVIIDRNGITRYKSPNIEKRFGWKPDDLVGLSALDNIHPDDHAKGQSLFSTLALTPNASGSIELRYRCKDGSYTWIEITVTNLLHDASINGFLGNYQDITERKLAEKALRESEEKYRFQFLNMNSYNSLYEVVTDKSGKPCDFRFIMVNHAYEKYVGKSAHELIGKTLLEVYPATEQYWIDKMAEVALTGVPSHFENFSHVMNTHTEINLYVPQKGQLAMTTGNIDDRRRAEQALRDSERHLKNSQKIAHLGSWRLDIATNQVMWTEELYAMYGFDPSLPPPPYTEHRKLFVPESWERLSAALANTRETGIPYEIELQTVKKDGSNGWLWVRGEAIKDSEGTTIGLWGAAQDISERKRMEEEIQKAQKLESLGLLAGGIAHDFNNLMGGIFGYIDMASEQTREKKVTSYLSKAMSTIERARALTQQLLTFAKGGAPVRRIGALFPFVQETAQFALSGSNVSCHFDVPQDLWACNFDKNQIGQVIDNLIINAQQAMPVGGTIDVSARNTVFAIGGKEHPVLENGKYVKISVRDTGVGIPKDLLIKIFDPFFTTKAKGHGLGLATCYSILKRHGGCIDVVSEPGKGSTFHVFLPASMESASSDAKKSAGAHQGSGTILVMDDEEVMRETIQNMLESLGYTVVCKENGKDAVAFFASEVKANRKIAGMIFDLTVPGGMGGLGAVVEIRKLNREIPVFVASGYTDDPVMKDPAEYGFTASISKPFMKNELAGMLEKYMKGTSIIIAAEIS